MPFQEYKELVGGLASICTIGQFFAGAFICKDIVKQGSTKNIPSTPFIGGLVIGTLMMINAHIINDEAMIRVSFYGTLLNVAYMLCFYVYAEDRADIRKQLAQGLAFVGIMYAYTRWESPDLVEFRYGLVVTALLMVLIASPLFSLGEVMRTQSTEKLPFPMILSGSVVAVLWLLYGIIIENTFVIVQNVVGSILSLVQLSLFVIYPRKPKGKAGKKSE